MNQDEMLTYICQECGASFDMEHRLSAEELARLYEIHGGAQMLMVCDDCYATVSMAIERLKDPS